MDNEVVGGERSGSDGGNESRMVHNEKYFNFFVLIV